MQLKVGLGHNRHSSVPTFSPLKVHIHGLYGFKSILSANVYELRPPVGGVLPEGVHASAISF